MKPRAAIHTCEKGTAPGICQHRTSTGPVLATIGMFIGLRTDKQKIIFHMCEKPRGFHNNSIYYCIILLPVL